MTVKSLHQLVSLDTLRVLNQALDAVTNLHNLTQSRPAHEAVQKIKGARRNIITHLHPEDRPEV